MLNIRVPIEMSKQLVADNNANINMKLKYHTRLQDAGKDNKHTSRRISDLKSHFFDWSMLVRYNHDDIVNKRQHTHVYMRMPSLEMQNMFDYHVKAVINRNAAYARKRAKDEALAAVNPNPRPKRTPFRDPVSTEIYIHDYQITSEEYFAAVGKPDVVYQNIEEEILDFYRKQMVFSTGVRKSLELRYEVPTSGNATVDIEMIRRAIASDSESKPVLPVENPPPVLPPEPEYIPEAKSTSTGISLLPSFLISKADVPIPHQPSSTPEIYSVEEQVSNLSLDDYVPDVSLLVEIKS